MDSNFELIETVSYSAGAWKGIPASHQIKDKTTGNYLNVFPHAFSNCQMFVLASAYNLIYLSTQTPENFIEKIREISNLCNTRKHLCQIDIKREYFNKIKDHIQIHSSMDYVNLTGSQMTSLIIKI